jgi:hypothetical protein
MLFPTSPTVGQVFTSGGRSWVWSGATWDSPAATNTLLAPYGLELVKTQVIGTGVSSVTVSEAFNATYDTYKVVINGGASSAADPYISMTLGSTTSGYSQTRIGYQYNGANNIGWDNSVSSWLVVGRANNNHIKLNLELTSPFLSCPTLLTGVDSPNVGSGFVSGVQASNTSFTSFTLTPQTGTLTGGTINIYGYRKAI